MRSASKAKAVIAQAPMGLSASKAKTTVIATPPQYPVSVEMRTATAQSIWHLLEKEKTTVERTRKAAHVLSSHHHRHLSQNSLSRMPLTPANPLRMMRSASASLRTIRQNARKVKTTAAVSSSPFVGRMTRTVSAMTSLACSNATRVPSVAPAL